MTVYQQEVELSQDNLMQCCNMLHAHPIFASFSESIIKRFANRFRQIRFHPGDIIVKQDDFVDSIYLIAFGSVEVRVTSKLNHHEETTPIATLCQGETIGLSETGFYSETGRRTATVVALTEVVLYKLNIGDFSDFLDEHPELDQILLGNSQLMLRMNFIKQIIPFSELSIEKLRRLAEEVNTIVIEPNQIIFQQGEVDGECFLIQTGKVELSVRKPDGREISIAELERPAIFGETAIVLDAPRNATAKTLTRCQLLTISRELLQEIISTEIGAEEAFMRLARLHCRPERKEFIEYYTQEAADGEIFTILKNVREGKYFRLTKEGWFIWQQLDGLHTVREITLALFEEYHFFNPGFVSQLIVELEQTGFVYVEEKSEKKFKKKIPLWLTFFISLKKIMEARWTLKHVDGWITTTYEGGVKWLYSKISLSLFALLIVSGFFVFISEFQHNITLMQATMGSGWLFFISIPIVMVALIFHELAHAYTTKYYGRKVFGFGVGWLWAGPIAFCDTSDMWLNSSRERIMVDLAGFYIQLAIAGIAAICGLFVTSPYLQLFLYYFSLLNYIIIFINLTPLIELDGYYVLMDYFDLANLKESSVWWLTHVFPSQWSRPQLWLQYKPQLIYWLICVIYIVLEAIFSYYVSRYLLMGIFGLSNPLISLFLSCVTVILSVLSIWAELKRKAYLI